MARKRACVYNRFNTKDQADEHGCDKFEEPVEGDYVTEDHHVFREHGTGKVLVCCKPEDWQEDVRQHMDREQFWPNVWFLSDHGNWHLLSLVE